MFLCKVNSASFSLSSVRTLVKVEEFAIKHKPCVGEREEKEEEDDEEEEEEGGFFEGWSTFCFLAGRPFFPKIPPPSMSVFVLTQQKKTIKRMPSKCKDGIGGILLFGFCAYNFVKSKDAIYI